MITERDLLENNLEKIISLYAKDRKVVSSVTKELNKRNVLDGEVGQIFKLTTPLVALSQSFLYCFTKAMFNATGEAKINPAVHFTKLEIESADKWKQEMKKEDDKYPVVFKNAIKLMDGVWLTKISGQELNNMFNIRTLTYNPETQRPLKRTEVNDKIIERVDVNPKAVQKIKNLILKGGFIPNCITINVLQDKDAHIEEKGNDVIIYSGNINLTDGYHRYRGISKALLDNPNLEYTTGVILTNFDIDRAKDFIFQEQQHNPLNAEYTKTLDTTKMSNQVVANINQKKNSYLKGQITKDLIMLKTGKALVMFNTLSDAIDNTFAPQETKDMITTSSVVIEGLNLIIESNDKLLTEPVDPRFWVTYICLIYLVYKLDDWHTIVEEVLPKINIDEISLKSINKTSVKNINEYLSTLLEGLV